MHSTAYALSTYRYIEMKQISLKVDPILETNKLAENAVLSLMSFYQDPDEQVDLDKVALHARDSELVGTMIIQKIIQDWGDILLDKYVAERSKGDIVPGTEELFRTVFHVLEIAPDNTESEAGMLCDEEPKRETEDSWIRHKMRTKNEGFKNRISAAERTRVHEHAILSDKRALQIAREKCWKFLTDEVTVQPRAIHHEEDTDPLDEQMRAYKTLIQAQEAEKQQHILAQEAVMTVNSHDTWHKLTLTS